MTTFDTPGRLARRAWRVRLPRVSFNLPVILAWITLTLVALWALFPGLFTG